MFSLKFFSQNEKSTVASFAAGIATPVMQIMVNFGGWSGAFGFVAICVAIMLGLLIVSDYLIKKIR